MLPHETKYYYYYYYDYDYDYDYLSRAKGDTEKTISPTTSEEPTTKKEGLLAKPPSMVAQYVP